jgi:N utilization substance protein B
MNIRFNKRHDSRILALSALFCWETIKGDPCRRFDEVLDFFLPEKLELINTKEYLEYARLIYNAVIKNINEIDQAISIASQGWAISRMPRVDLCIIRLAVAEINYGGNAPLEVVLDEAVELAKEYSTHASQRFVNGVLMGILRNLGVLFK